MEVDNKKGHSGRITLIEMGARNLYNYLSIEISGKDYILGETSFIMIDIYETQDTLYVEAEVPGMTAEEIRVYLDGGNLTIEGVKQEERLHSEGRINFLCMERAFGPFKRIINIPSAVNTHNIKASYADGILTVCLPKNVERRKAYKRIAIE